MIQGPYKLPEGWRWVRLGEICSINPRRPRILRDAGAPTTFVPMCAVNEMDGTIVAAETKRFSEVCKGYTYFQEGDILFAKITPCMENGKSTIARRLIDGIGFGSTEFHVLRTKGVAVPEWIWLFLRREDFRVAAKRAFRGGVGQQRVPVEFLKEIPIPLPPLDEQRRIVGQIEEMMARVHEAKRLRKEAMVEAERLWQSILTEIFPQLDSDLPSGWRWVRLGDVANKPQYGFTASSTFEQVGPRFLRITDIQGGVVNWENVPHCFCNEKTLKKYRLDNGDVLFARSGATTGKSYLVSNPPFEAVFASYLIRVKLKSHILDPEFAFLYFQSPYYWEQIKPRGAAQPNINASTLRKLLIPLPPIPKQRCIVAYLRAVQTNVKALREAQEATDKKLKRLEQTILDKAFRGEL